MNLPSEILTLSHSGFKYCSVLCKEWQIETAMQTAEYVANGTFFFGSEQFGRKCLFPYDFYITLINKILFSFSKR